jgi:hypothetical protein
MTRKSLQVVGVLLTILSTSIPAVYAFVYQQQSHNISQIIIKVAVLRPNGAGSITNLSPYGMSSNWQCVNDSGDGDGDGTYVYSTSNGWRYDTYQIQNHTSESGTIIKVTIYIRARGIGGTGRAMTVIRTHNTEYQGTQNTLTNSYIVYSTEYTTNPFTNNAWTWDEIDALEAGVRLRTTSGRCTQVWIKVEY